MKRLLILSSVLILLFACAPSFGYVLVYKLSTKVKTVDTSIDAPAVVRMKGYLIIDYNETGQDINDANLIWYGKDKDKTRAFFHFGYADLNFDFLQDINNCVVNFSRGDRDAFEAMLTGKTVTRAIGLVTKKAVPGTLKGSILVWEDIFLDSAWNNLKGSGSVSARLYSALTKAANESSFSSSSVTDALIDEFFEDGYVNATWSVDANCTWSVDARCFLDGPPGEFDDVSVKDPSIVYSGGKWHLFYTGRDSSYWRMGYVSATSISDLNSATRTLMTSLNGGSYFCAPQVFYFGAKGKWYLIYQSGLGATYSTNTDVGNPGGWTAGSAMGITDSGALDFWCISDGTNVYCFYSPMDGSRTIKRRSTTVANFPTGWSSASVVATSTFEAVHVYRNRADGRYYMMVEDINRHFELWTASNLGGTWTQLQEQWAHKDKLVDNDEHWTDQVSHGEILRSGTNERLEIDNINHCQILIQGVTSANYCPGGDYSASLYDLGLIRNY